ncbi:hypothetical protein Mp_5g19340 [Marchantia polymorpha subsp. ruderalis]|uniref:Uncharacterized protein n=2 Tax=Marchantia polymorpha TaxID=3197 RepID=A0AAF6BK13_MARPO|nr:hypothetical protein MARPO_0073s0010 [Marchantia polymorpha]BBN12347.1 hypothetical protein Mp_5g19340 [Marchantia polymorpha subsp. ruderalis]|eukprot:PTQ35130.1 hypothetical protein MARPO_0073s0010 [Marchantia polymorpha]
MESLVFFYSSMPDARSMFHHVLLEKIIQFFEHSRDSGNSPFSQREGRKIRFRRRSRSSSADHERIWRDRSPSRKWRWMEGH